MAEYIPGVCNIGEEEVKGRIVSGWLGLILTIVIAAILVYLQATKWTYLVLFFPAFIGALGFLQGAFHFCVAFGTQGLFNVSQGMGHTESVSQAEYRSKDQKKVVLILVYSGIIAVIIAGASLLSLSTFS
ncbi:MAG: hypothetical protein AB203_02290 [Parcubacteria bacterium C7867-008]|nr:MAG: hypothetical protein AB203_02290 [Parcubacteria bacterium C7867-008]